MKVRVVRATALLLLGSYAGGVLFAVLAPRVYELPGPAYVRYWQAVNLDYGAAMPVLLLSCVALLIATSVLSVPRGRLVSGLDVAATLLVVGTIVLTLTRMEPLNDIGDAWDPDALPAGWAATVDAWRNLHLVRTVLAVAAFALLLASQALDVRVPARRDARSAEVAAG